MLNASAARIPSAIFHRVALNGERIQIRRRGGPVVYLVGETDVRRLEELEQDREGGDATTNDARRPVALDELEARLNRLVANDQAPAAVGGSTT